MNLPSEWKLMRPGSMAMMLADVGNVDTSEPVHHHPDSDAILYRTHGGAWGAADLSGNVDVSCSGNTPSEALRLLAAAARESDDEDDDFFAHVCIAAAEALDGSPQ